jgi:hypothetical protein
MEVITMGGHDELTGSQGMTGGPGTAGGEGQGAVIGEPPSPRVEKKRRKVSLIAAIVVNVVTTLTVAIILLAVLMPGYRKSFTMARAVKGSEDVWIVVRTSESTIRENSSDFISAQDGLKNALQELAGSGRDNVWAYVRDSYPDRAWIESNLPEDMQLWLEQLYPKPQVEEIKPEDEQQEAPDGDEGEQPDEETTVQAPGR